MTENLKGSCYVCFKVRLQDGHCVNIVNNWTEIEEGTKVIVHLPGSLKLPQKGVIVGIGAIVYSNECMRIDND